MPTCLNSIFYATKAASYLFLLRMHPHPFFLAIISPVHAISAEISRISSSLQFPVIEIYLHILTQPLSHALTFPLVWPHWISLSLSSFLNGPILIVSLHASCETKYKKSNCADLSGVITFCVYLLPYKNSRNMHNHPVSIPFFPLCLLVQGLNEWILRVLCSTGSAFFSSKLNVSALGFEPILSRVFEVRRQTRYDWTVRQQRSMATPLRRLYIILNDGLYITPTILKRKMSVVTLWFEYSSIWPNWPRTGFHYQSGTTYWQTKIRKQSDLTGWR